ncbi:MAG: PspC domain-containing protein [Dermatophilaceae bacterium]
MESIHRSLAKSGYYRMDSGRWLGGVCAGVSRQLGVDVAALRWLTVLLFFLGAPVLAYVALWVVMPDEATARRLTASPYVAPDGPQDDVPRR